MRIVIAEIEPFLPVDPLVLAAVAPLCSLILLDLNRFLKGHIGATLTPCLTQ